MNIVDIAIAKKLAGGGGGGGSSDFSTAEVVLTCGANKMSFSPESEDGNTESLIVNNGKYYVYNDDITNGGTFSLTIMMLQTPAMAFSVFRTSDEPVITGNATKGRTGGDGWWISISGDCSITVL